MKKLPDFGYCPNECHCDVCDVVKVFNACIDTVDGRQFTVCQECLDEAVEVARRNSLDFIG